MPTSKPSLRDKLFKHLDAFLEDLCYGETVQARLWQELHPLPRLLLLQSSFMESYVFDACGGPLRPPTAEAWLNNTQAILHLQEVLDGHLQDEWPSRSFVFHLQKTFKRKTPWLTPQKASPAEVSRENPAYEELRSQVEVLLGPLQTIAFLEFCSSPKVYQAWTALSVLKDLQKEDSRMKRKKFKKRVAGKALAKEYPRKYQELFWRDFWQDQRGFITVLQDGESRSEKVLWQEEAPDDR